MPILQPHCRLMNLSKKVVPAQTVIQFGLQLGPG